MRCTLFDALNLFIIGPKLKTEGKRKVKASTAGFEPAQAKPNRFRVCLLNHSDISTFILRILQIFN